MFYVSTFFYMDIVCILFYWNLFYSICWMVPSCFNSLVEYFTRSNVFSSLQAAHMQEALEESVQMMKEAVDDLGATLAEAASAAGAVGGMVDSINDAINKMEDSPALDPEGTFVDYQTTMVKTAKAIAVTVQEMVRHFDDYIVGLSSPEACNM